MLGDLGGIIGSLSLLSISLLEILIGKYQY
jgi:hypothetical protein